MSAMPDPRATTSRDDGAARRAGVRRTAWMLGLVALVVYVGFILTGFLGK